jgi:hypothetical protein
MTVSAFNTLHPLLQQSVSKTKVWLPFISCVSDPYMKILPVILPGLVFAFFVIPLHNRALIS